jgi:hypothetical protein
MATGLRVTKWERCWLPASRRSVRRASRTGTGELGLRANLDRSEACQSRSSAAMRAARVTGATCNGGDAFHARRLVPHDQLPQYLLGSVAVHAGLPSVAAGVRAGAWHDRQPACLAAGLVAATAHRDTGPRFCCHGNGVGRVRALGGNQPVAADLTTQVAKSERAGALPIAEKHVPRTVAGWLSACPGAGH